MFDVLPSISSTTVHVLLPSDHHRRPHTDRRKTRASYPKRCRFSKSELKSRERESERERERPETERESAEAIVQLSEGRLQKTPVGSKNFFTVRSSSKICGHRDVVSTSCKVSCVGLGPFALFKFVCLVVQFFSILNHPGGQLVWLSG